MKEENTMFRSKALTTFLRVMLISILVSGLVGCSLNPPPVVNETTPESIAALQRLPVNARPRIAVLDFTNKANPSSKSEIGEGMADQMVTALSSAGAFRVIERSRLDAVNQEQIMNNSGRFNPEAATKIGNLLGVNFFIAGAITEFEGNEAGLDGMLGSSAMSHWGPYGWALSAVQTTFKQTHIAIDVRVIDVKTGEVVHANSVEGSPRSMGAGLSGFMGRVGLAFGGGMKTPVEEAVRDCIKKSVNEVAIGMKGFKPGEEIAQPDPKAASAKPVVKVTAETGTLRASASTEGRKIKTLKEGDSLEVVEDSGKWTKVKTSDGTEGWVLNKIIEPKEEE
jgi:curli biogenesis system outer membrane secretion channel CsgG